MATPGPAVDMRHTKLSAEDAALIAGELVKPSWASRNEGIHERISFDDTLWGFELAGGSFYKTPLRVVYVKPGSRADQACIRKGDTVLKINGIDTSTLTLQEAHDIVLESGIHLKISVTAPEDDEDQYYVYEDPLAEESRLAEELRKAMEAERIRRALARANRTCSLKWPWVRRRNLIYRESNCYLVPSKYESKHKALFPEIPHLRYTEDILECERIPEPSAAKPKENGLKPESEDKENGEYTTDNEEDVSSMMDEKEQNEIINQILEQDEDEAIKEDVQNELFNHDIPSDIDTDHSELNGEVVGPDNEEDELENKMEIEENTEEELGNEVKPDLDDEVQEDIEDSQTNEEDLEVETNETVETILPSINVVDNDDYMESESSEFESSIAPVNDFVEEEGLNKSDEDNVVDSIVGENSRDVDVNDSTNER